MTTSKVTKAVDGFPDLMVCQGGKNVFNQNQEENEAALPEPPPKKARHVPPATEPRLAPPPVASFEQAVPSSPIAASWETPLLCRDGHCNQLRSAVFKNVTYSVDVDSPVSDSSSHGAFVTIRWMCYHCDTTSSQCVRP